MKIVSVVAISFSLVFGASIISFIVVLFLEPSVFIYYDRGAFAFIGINFLFIIALYGISSRLIIHREIMVEKEKAIGVERDLRNRMEMKLLSSRVNPHFLFNTLNMILTLVRQPDKAEAATSSHAGFRVSVFAFRFDAAFPAITRPAILHG